MFAEAQRQVVERTSSREGFVHVCVGVVPENEHWQLGVLHENCIGMSTKQAYEFAQNIYAQIAETVAILTHDCSLSGLLLFGGNDFMAGLNNSTWLRIPLASFPGLSALTPDQRANFCILPDRFGFEWPEHGLTLTLPEMVQNAIAVENGDDAPN